MDSKELVELFLKFEDEYDMFHIKINNVYIWHYLRFFVYGELTKLFGIYDEKIRYGYKSDNHKMSLKECWLKNITCNQFFVHKRDVLILPHQRKYKDGDRYYKCIYTHLLDEYLINSHYVLDEKSTGNEYVAQKSRNVVYSDIPLFCKIRRLKFSAESVSKDEINTQIFESIEKYFDINIGLEFKKRLFKHINNCINTRKKIICYYDYMLKKIKPKIILILVSYEFGRMVLCEVAKKRNIPVVEIQHGAMGPGAIQYNFYKKMNLSSFPDYIFTFGQYEKEDTRFPIKKEKIIPVGYPELEKNYNLYKKKKTTRKTVVFISQGLIEIAAYASIVADKLDAEKYHIIFKLHPKEYYDWKLTMGKYLHHSNIEVVGNYEYTIYEFLSQADWIIGNYSTVLYEAQMFDVKVAVLKFGQYQIVEYLYENGYAVLVDSPEQLVKVIEKDTFQPNKTISLFEKNSLQKMQESINDIIEQYSKR